MMAKMDMHPHIIRPTRWPKRALISFLTPLVLTFSYYITYYENESRKLWLTSHTDVFAMAALTLFFKLILWSYYGEIYYTINFNY